MSRPGAVVVGTGFGLRIHVPALRAAGFRVEALVGRDPARTARRAARAGVPHALTSLAAALELDGVTAVTVATPPSTHAELALAAVRAGKHVLCEKPFATDVAEARTMAAAAAATGLTALVGHEFRWATDRAVARRALAAGLVGEPRLVTLVQHVPLVADPAARVPGWWFSHDAGGGWLGASGSHMVDLVRSWLGDFAEVSATLHMTGDRDATTEDSFTVRFTLRSGVHGVLQETAAAWGPLASLQRVTGTRGTLWLEGGVAHVADVTGTRALPVPPDLALPPPPPAVRGDPRHRFTHLELGPYTRLCEALAAGVEGRALPEAVPAPTFADGLAVTEVLDAVRTSAARGGERVVVTA